MATVWGEIKDISAKRAFFIITLWIVYKLPNQTIDLLFVKLLTKPN